MPRLILIVDETVEETIIEAYKVDNADKFIAQAQTYFEYVFPIISVDIDDEDFLDMIEKVCR